MSNNKKALTLIIERLGDVHMVRYLADEPNNELTISKYRTLSLLKSKMMTTFGKTFSNILTHVHTELSSCQESSKAYDMRGR
jgi:hypothetical protein